MTTLQTVATIIGTALTMLGGLIGFLTYRDKKQANATAEGQQNGVVYTELGYIKRGIDEIRADNKECNLRNAEQYTELCVLVAKADDKASSAHKRIDGLEKVISIKN